DLWTSSKAPTLGESSRATTISSRRTAMVCKPTPGRSDLCMIAGHAGLHPGRQGRGGSMAADNEIDPETAPSGPGCVECVAADGWSFHLRRCARCGHVGCCDSSPSQHAI